MKNYINTCYIKSLISDVTNINKHWFLKCCLLMALAILFLSMNLQAFANTDATTKKLNKVKTEIKQVNETINRVEKIKDKEKQFKKNEREIWKLEKKAEKLREKLSKKFKYHVYKTGEGKIITVDPKTIVGDPPDSWTFKGTGVDVDNEEYKKAMKPTLDKIKKLKQENKDIEDYESGRLKKKLAILDKKRKKYEKIIERRKKYLEKKNKKKLSNSYGSSNKQYSLSASSANYVPVQPLPRVNLDMVKQYMNGNSSSTNVEGDLTQMLSTVQDNKQKFNDSRGVNNVNCSNCNSYYMPPVFSTDAAGSSNIMNRVAAVSKLTTKEKKNCNKKTNPVTQTSVPVVNNVTNTTPVVNNSVPVVNVPEPVTETLPVTVNTESGCPLANSNSALLEGQTGGNEINPMQNYGVYGLMNHINNISF